MIGQTIGHYRIVAEIGRGGMGVVYRAEDTRLYCFRALKFLPRTVTRGSLAHTRLVNEARTLAALEHSHICPVQEIGEHEDQTFIVMSFLEGRTLKERLAEGPLPLDEAMVVSRQIASALAAAHARGIVHRDVKPDNVMLTEANDGSQGAPRAVLMDFGIAKNQESTLATLAGTVMGTAAYMSPEQARGEKIDAATDVWSLGVMLFEMLSGKRPFKGDNVPALLNVIASGEPETFVGAASAVPEPVERVIGRALEKDRNRRYPDAAQMLADLDRAAAEEKVKGRRLQRGHKGRWAGIGAGVLGLLLLALFVWPGFLTTSDAISVLAVMPLEDRSEEPDPTFYAEGIADELVTRLSKLRTLTLVSRASASRAREIYASNREIGSALGVDALIEGSIQREAERIRVSVQLVATENDRLLWSESYTRNISDILDLQSEIALTISSVLETELSPGERESLSRQRQVDPKAYEEYLIGNHFLKMATGTSAQQAREHFEQALAIEPDFADAHVRLASAYVLYQQMAGLPPSAVEEYVKGHARRAIEIEPDLAESHAVMARVSGYYDWDLTAAGAFFARARELDPSLGMMDYAQYLNLVGRHRDALREAQLAARVDPLDPFITANLAARYFFAGQIEEGLAVIDRLHEREPDFWIGHWLLGKIHLMNDDPVQAIESYRKAVAHSGDSPVVKPDLAYALVLADRREEALKILESLQKHAEEDYVAPYYLGQMYAGLGRADEAFAAFDRSLEERDWLLLWFDVSFFTVASELKTDPRWADLIERIDLLTK